MTKDQTATAAIPAFDLDDLAAIDTAELVIKSRDGTPTPWVWTIAGPGHPQSIALANRMNREALALEREKETARVNGRKWKGDDASADESLKTRLGRLADRVVGWTPITMGGEPYPFSHANVVSILMDPKRGDTLLGQLAEFLTDDATFTKRSAKD